MISSHKNHDSMDKQNIWNCTNDMNTDEFVIKRQVFTWNLDWQMAELCAVKILRNLTALKRLHMQ